MSYFGLGVYCRGRTQSRAIPVPCHPSCSCRFTRSEQNRGLSDKAYRRHRRKPNVPTRARTKDKLSQRRLLNDQIYALRPARSHGPPLPGSDDPGPQILRTSVESVLGIWRGHFVMHRKRRKGINEQAASEDNLSWRDLRVKSTAQGRKGGVGQIVLFCLR
jgi:hypothetical protein